MAFRQTEHEKARRALVITKGGAEWEVGAEGWEAARPNASPNECVTKRILLLGLLCLLLHLSLPLTLFRLWFFGLHFNAFIMHSAEKSQPQTEMENQRAWQKVFPKFPAKLRGIRRRGVCVASRETSIRDTALSGQQMKTFEHASGEIC